MAKHCGFSAPNIKDKRDITVCVSCLASTRDVQWLERCGAFQNLSQLPLGFPQSLRHLQEHRQSGRHLLLQRRTQVALSSASQRVQHKQTQVVSSALRWCWQVQDRKHCFPPHHKHNFGWIGCGKYHIPSFTDEKLRRKEDQWLTHSHRVQTHKGKVRTCSRDPRGMLLPLASVALRFIKHLFLIHRHVLRKQGTIILINPGAESLISSEVTD